MSKFPPIFCISLARATERQTVMVKRLDALGFPYKMIDAVDGATLDLSQLDDRLRPDKFRRKFGRDMVPGEIGCFLSHYNLWESLIATGEEYALVLEDDVDLSDDFTAVVADIVALNLEWDIVVLHTPRNKYPVDIIAKNIADKGYKLGRANRRIVRTAGYLIRLRGAQRLHEYCREISAPIDVQYEEWWHNRLAFYCIYPGVVVSDGAESLITSDNGIGRSDFKKASLTERFAAFRWRKLNRWCCRFYRWTHPVPKIASSKK